MGSRVVGMGPIEAPDERRSIPIAPVFERLLMYAFDPLRTLRGGCLLVSSLGLTSRH
jgi:hypothetical protein